MIFKTLIIAFFILICTILLSIKMQIDLTNDILNRISLKFDTIKFEIKDALREIYIENRGR